MAAYLNVCLCLAWFINLADTDMFLSLPGSTLDQVISEMKAANELSCSRLCKKTEGCNAFSFSAADGECELARGSVGGSVPGLVYSRPGAQSSNASQSSVTTTAIPPPTVTTVPVIPTPVATTPVSTDISQKSYTLSNIIWDVGRMMLKCTLHPFKQLYETIDELLI